MNEVYDIQPGDWVKLTTWGYWDGHRVINPERQIEFEAYSSMKRPYLDIVKEEKNNV